MTNAVNIAQGGSNNVTFRNKIINGAMVIDQRNAGASVSAVNGTYTLDRWFSFSYAGSPVTGKFTVQQTPSATETGYATRVAAGFTNYLACTSSAATSVASTSIYGISQWIEGYNVSDLVWGTTSAKTVTLSFWAYSSLTGTFGGVVRNIDGDRAYPFTYTISTASTWTQVSITITGDTTGTWNKTNGAGIGIIFGIGVGSSYSGTAGAWAAGSYYSATGATQVVATSGATFYITGAQLEAGTTASPFEYRQFGTELMLCQRYYEKNYDLNTAIGTASPSTNSYSRLALSPRYGSTAYGSIPYKVLKRTQPSVSFWSAGGAASLWDAYAVTNTSTTLTPSYNDGGQYNLNISVGSSTSYDLIQGYWAASAEL